MSNEGLQKFIGDLGLDIETAESLIGFYVLGLPSFIEVTFKDFEQALKKFNTISVTQVASKVKSEASLYKVSTFHQTNKQFRAI